MRASLPGQLAIAGIWFALASCSTPSEPLPQPEPPAPVSTASDAGREQPPTTNSLTGLIDAPGSHFVVANCQACHSLKLVTQNRATRDGWDTMLKWMSAKHNLPEFDNATRNGILDYLAANYAPDLDQATVRRRPLAGHLMPPTSAALAGEPNTK